MGLIADVTAEIFKFKNMSVENFVKCSFKFSMDWCLTIGDVYIKCHLKLNFFHLPFFLNKSDQNS